MNIVSVRKEVAPRESVKSQTDNNREIYKNLNENMKNMMVIMYGLIQEQMKLHVEFLSNSKLLMENRIKPGNNFVGPIKRLLRRFKRTKRNRKTKLSSEYIEIDGGESEGEKYLVLVGYIRRFLQINADKNNMASLDIQNIIAPGTPSVRDSSSFRDSPTEASSLIFGGNNNVRYKANKSTTKKRKNRRT